MAKETQDEPSNSARALWTFLGYMLVGPFFAGLVTAAGLIVLPLVGMGAHLPPGLPSVGEAAVSVFVWAATPAALAAAVVTPRVLRTGSFGWLMAAIAGGIAVFAASIITGIPGQEAVTLPAFLGGLIAIGVRQALLAGGIIRGEP